VGPRLVLVALVLGTLALGGCSQEEQATAESTKATTVEAGDKTAATGGPKLEINPDYKAPK